MRRLILLFKANRQRALRCAVPWSRVVAGGASLWLLQATATPTPAQAPPRQPPVASPALPRPIPLAPPALAPPPTAQAYVAAEPGARSSQGHVMVPITFLMNELGTSAGMVGDFWRLVYFGHTVEVYPGQSGARFDGQQVTLPAQPQYLGATLYVPWEPIADLFKIKWRIMDPTDKASPARTVFLLQYPAAYIEGVRSAIDADKLRLVLNLSNATRVVATQKGADIQFHLSASRKPGVPTVQPINDYLVPRTVTRSGQWEADFTVRMNYAAPIHWFTLGSPPRLVVDAQRLFEEKNTNFLGSGLSMTKIRKGTQQGPVQMFVVRIDPDEGWRVRVASGGYSVLQRNRPSRIAHRNRALVAVNGGFFANDGAAVGAVMINDEWLRLPWKGRTALAFRPDGEAKIGNLQAKAHVTFSGGAQLPIRELNGWPKQGIVTVLTGRFGNHFTLRPGEIGIVVKDGVILAKPGGGNAPIYPNGFTLIASGGALPYLKDAQRGQQVKLDIQALGWDGYTSALGGGPRLVDNGRIEVTDLRESFRADVRVGRGPRTAFGIDKDGRYIILVVDGRKNYYSIGLTLTELAATMQRLGAVNAVNLDGGGSTAMTVRDRVVNHPSDGVERSVSNALLVMR